MKHKTKLKENNKPRCCVSNKLINGKEIIRIDYIDVYIEKQAKKYEYVQTARKIVRENKK